MPEPWPCLTCGEPIRVNPHAGLGEPRYVHVTPSGHLALRGPSTQPMVSDDEPTFEEFAADNADWHGTHSMVSEDDRG